MSIKLLSLSLSYLSPSPSLASPRPRSKIVTNPDVVSPHLLLPVTRCKRASPRPISNVLSASICRQQKYIITLKKNLITLNNNYASQLCCLLPSALAIKIIHYTKINIKRAVCFHATEKSIQNTYSKKLKGCVVCVSNHVSYAPKCVANVLLMCCSCVASVLLVCC